MPFTRQTLTETDLNAALMTLPGFEMGDSYGCLLFCKQFSQCKSTFKITFEDFIYAFLPVQLDNAKRLLQREPRTRASNYVPDAKQVFYPTTNAQFTLAWKTYFQELRKIEALKKKLIRHLSYNGEDIYFNISGEKRLYFDKHDLKVFMMQRGVRLGKDHDFEIDLMIQFFFKHKKGKYGL